MSATTKPITIPATLQIGWALLLLGFVALSAGYFTQTPWQSLSGLLCFIVGYVIVILDMLYRKRPTSDAASFYAGFLLAQVISAFSFAFLIVPLFAICLAILSTIYGFQSSGAMRLLHFLGIILAYMVVINIRVGLALKAEPKNQTEQSVSANGV